MGELDLTPKCLLRRAGEARAGWLALLFAIPVVAIMAAACGGGEEASVAMEGDRITVTLAVVDDANRHAALYAIEQGIATSETVDLDVTYLPPSAISDAASSKLHDIIEVSPLEVPLAEAKDMAFVVLSAGMQNTDGTLLFVDADAGPMDPGDLRGKTIAVASLESTFTLDTRYLLQEGYGLDASLEAGDVTIMEQPAEALPTVVSAGEVDAVVMVNRGAFSMLEDDGFRVLSHVTDEVQELLGTPVMSSILITYPDIAGEKTDALSEVNRLLAESVMYFNANQDHVIEAVATEQESADYLAWWWEGNDLVFGDVSVEAQERLLGVWEAAKAIGDIDEYPDLAVVIFNAESATPEAEDPR